MKRSPRKMFHLSGMLALGLWLVPFQAMGFDSGSTGVDGAFSPTVDATLQLPEDGIFNFTEVNIPEGVTVGFSKNTTNTPVTILVSGDVTVAGTLHVNASWSTPVGAAGDGNVGDDGLPGVGGPGGHDGGRGGEPELSGGIRAAGNGLGPGGGQGGYSFVWYGTYYRLGGGGGGFGTAGGTSWVNIGGNIYGSEVLLPLVGGSGGGGGYGGTSFHGSGGGGGGGALLIAASGTVTVTGAIRANGGGSGASSGSGSGASGGGGSGGAIRIVATQIDGNGTITAAPGLSGTYTERYTQSGGKGGTGRIRLEAEIFTRTAASDPAFSFAQPTTVFIAGLPTLRIASVAGVAAPALPTGNADIVLPADTPNPVTVVFNTSSVPVGNTVKLTVTPAYGAPTSVVSPALTGTTDGATASVSVDLPSGPSVLSAQTTYTILASLGDALSTYAQGERVEKIRVASTLNGPSTVVLITVSGKEYTLPSMIPAMPVVAG